MNALIQYKSSAGSGKTFTLVVEYLRLVIENPYEYRQVLAVTFTNKATEEMKSRIIETLADLAYLPENQQATHPVYSNLQSYFEQKGKRPDYPISQRARQVLTLILSDYSNFSVSTIESFFQRVIRSFAKELDLPLGYEIDMQHDVTLERIVNAAMKEIGENETLTRLLKGFLEQNMDEEKGWRLENRIKDLGKEIFREEFQTLVSEFRDREMSADQVLALAKELKKVRYRFETQMETWAKEALSIMEDLGLQRTDFKYKGGSVPGYFINALDKKAYEPGVRAKKAAAGENEWYSSKDAMAARIEEALEAGLQGCLERMVDLYEAEFIAYNTAGIVLKTLYAFGVMQDLRRQLETYRRENHRLIISDTNFLLKEIISDRDTPFVYEKVGTRYRYYLLDEFQDTSDMQWDNLEPLVVESVSTGSKSLIVGDVKQSIYRWRNGNLNLLLKDVKERMGQKGIFVETLSLLSNWRTAYPVVNFNNQFFETATSLVGETFSGGGDNKINLAYKGALQEAERKDMPGRVSVEFFSKPDKKADQEELDWQEQAMERTVEIIRSVVEDGFDPGDITLLVRTNREGEKLAEYLQRQTPPVPVLSAESLKLLHHPQVRFLLSLLKYLNHEVQPLHGAMAAYYHFLLQQSQGNAGQLSLTLSDPDVVEHRVFGQEAQSLPEAFLESRDKLRELPVYECLEQLRRMFPGLLSPNAYVQGLLDAALEYSSQNDASIAGFLAHWEEIKDKRSIATASDARAVQIMTIHKAKGLEFPVVIMPLADWKMEPSPGSILWIKPRKPPYDMLPFLPVSYSGGLEKSFFAEEYAEERMMSYLDNLNLLYVAFTRPKYRLYVLTLLEENPKKEEVKNIHQLISRVLDKGTVEGRHREDPRPAFEVGERVPFVRKKVQSSTSELLQARKRPLVHWNDAVRIRFSSNQYLQTGIRERNRRIIEGELLHEALAYVITPQDIPLAVEKMILKGLVSAEDRQDFAGRLEETISHPDARQWFEPGWEVHTEAEIIDETGKVNRLDRVNIQADRAVVIDYKTGQMKDVYTKQVNFYRQLLSKIGYTYVEAYLFYTQLGEVKKIF